MSIATCCLFFFENVFDGEKTFVISIALHYLCLLFENIFFYEKKICDIYHFALKFCFSF